MTENEKLDLILEKMSDLEGKISNIETDVSAMKMTIENEIRVNKKWVFTVPCFHASGLLVSFFIARMA